jgi:aspartyl-tRNA(Asn)/glutamyl-tRNA(Gln) amidotransferase subunit A
MTSSSRERTEAALARIAAPEGEGERACLSVYAHTARAAADAADVRAKAGTALGPLDGCVVSIKDLFDVQGEVTRAGSALLARSAAPARADAEAVARLRAAGAVIVAKTNMTEFAFSGVGANPHYGTPGNPRDRARIPGGSTSGGAVACADGMCEIAVGTDTGGSTRIPASLCGLVGWKPTARRIPTAGVHALSPSLDSVGPIARDVAACALVDAVLAAQPYEAREPVELGTLRVATLEGFVLDELEHQVADAFERSLKRLASLRRRQALPLESLDAWKLLDAVTRRGGIAAREAYVEHRTLLERDPDAIDPFVRARLQGGANISDADHQANLRERAQAITLMDRVFDDYDLLVLPTTPICAPTLEEVSTAEGFAAKNRLLLRNTSIANFFDLCAISLPMPDAQPMPSGLMLLGRSGSDRALLSAAAAIEAALR